MKDRKELQACAVLILLACCCVLSACAPEAKAGPEETGRPGAEAAQDQALVDQGAQKQTVKDIRNVGTAMFSWLTDQVGAAAAGQSQTPAPKEVALSNYPAISHEELAGILVPQYIQELPVTDGWGHDYEFRLNTENPLAPQVMSIRSPGRDGTFSTDSYTVTSFDPTSFDEDIVWADGFFVHWPQRQ